MLAEAEASGQVVFWPSRASRLTPVRTDILRSLLNIPKPFTLRYVFELCMSFERDQ